jgi:alkylresorcinol/alkylpyrone synthase/polyketide synthase Type III
MKPESQQSLGLSSMIAEMHRGFDHLMQFSHMHNDMVGGLLAGLQAQQPQQRQSASTSAPAAFQVLGIGTHAPRSYTQSEVLDILGYRGHKLAELIVKNAAIETRSFYKTTRDFGPEVTAETLAEYHREYAPRLAFEALKQAAGDLLDLRELDVLVTTTSTGFMSPGIAEVLYETYDVGRADTLRCNLVGNGCVGTIPALQIAQSFLQAGQAKRVGVICAEAVAALFNPHSAGKMTLVQHLIFGEGGAALILGRQGSVVNGTPLPHFLDSYQEIAHHSLDAIAIRQSEFWESVTDKTIPELVGQLVPRVVQQLLQRHHLTMGDIAHWAFHTGGRKILEVCQECLSLSDAQMKPSYEVLWQYGNMLSASVVFSLQQMLNERRPQPGELGMLLALGPGMTGGAFLLSW